jgi:hypothetical protein
MTDGANTSGGVALTGLGGAALSGPGIRNGDAPSDRRNTPAHPPRLICAIACRLRPTTSRRLLAGATRREISAAYT